MKLWLEWLIRSREQSRNALAAADAWKRKRAREGPSSEVPTLMVFANLR